VVAAGDLLDDVLQPAPGGLGASECAADGHGLAGDNARLGVALMHRDRVHDPGHDLLVGAHVRRGNVLGRADDDADLGGVAAGQALQLVAGERPWVDEDAALGAAVRQVYDGGLPGHPHRQRPHFVERDVEAVADAALGRATREVVLDAVPVEDPERPVVHVDGKVDGQLALAVSEHLPEPEVEAEPLGRGVELGERCCQDAGFGFGRGGRVLLYDHCLSRL